MSSNGHDVESILGTVHAGAWVRLADRRIFFAHQSVGSNMLSGVAELVARRPVVKLRILELAEGSVLDGPALAHAAIGANRDPSSKIKAFADRLHSGIGARADIAVLKLCYADVEAGSQPERLFDHYANIMDELARAFPRVVLGHMTVPLMAAQRGPKALAKRLLGRRPWGHEDNERRGVYNRLMREVYGRDGRLFDIAAIESRRPDGSAELVRCNGRSHQALAPCYTDDGGHLGPLGRATVGSEMLLWLAKLA